MEPVRNSQVHKAINTSPSRRRRFLSIVTFSSASTLMLFEFDLFGRLIELCDTGVINLSLAECVAWFEINVYKSQFGTI